ncbi:hypothetical protein ACXET9_15290 [Brachybacterium sp. DNPG3]
MTRRRRTDRPEIRPASGDWAGSRTERCPTCGSARITAESAPQLTLDEELAALLDPERGRALVRRPAAEAFRCRNCLTTWSTQRYAPPRPLRLRSETGGMLALLPVPSIDDLQGPAMDLELVTPDRLVRYLARPRDDRALEHLARFFQEAAAAEPRDGEPHDDEPRDAERSDGEPHDGERPDDEEEALLEHVDLLAGLRVRVLASDETTVQLEIVVIDDLDAIEDREDREDRGGATVGLIMDVRRSELISAAHALEEWWR